MGPRPSLIWVSWWKPGAGKVASKKKADCSPEEWTALLERNKIYRKTEASPEVRERMPASKRAWNARNPRGPTLSHRRDGGQDEAYQAHLAANRARRKRQRDEARAAREEAKKLAAMTENQRYRYRLSKDPERLARFREKLREREAKRRERMRADPELNRKILVKFRAA